MRLLDRIVLTAVVLTVAVAFAYAIPKDNALPAVAGAPKAKSDAKPASTPAKPAADSATKAKEAAAERAAKAEAVKNARQEAALNYGLRSKRAKVQFEQTSVKDILKYLGDVGGFSVVFDPELEQNGIDLSTRLVSMSFTGVKYEDALTLLLPRECGYRVGPGYILVTTLEKSWTPLRTATYSIHMALAEVPNFSAPRLEIADITKQASQVGGGGMGGLFQPPAAEKEEGKVTPDRIIEIVKKFVKNENDRRIAPWDDEGGPASITFLNGSLIVSQTDQGQRAVAELLAELF